MATRRFANVVNKLVFSAYPQQYFRRYLATPVVSQLALDSIPELTAALRELEGLITTEELIASVNKLVKHELAPAIAQNLSEQALQKTSQRP